MPQLLVRLSALALILLLPSCRRDPDHVLRQTREAIDSWSSTLTLARDNRARGGVPARFIPQLVRSAEKALDQQQKALNDISTRQPGWQDTDAALHRTRTQARDLLEAGRDGPTEHAAGSGGAA